MPGEFVNIAGRQESIRPMFPCIMVAVVKKFDGRPLACLQDKTVFAVAQPRDEFHPVARGISNRERIHVPPPRKDDVLTARAFR